jgi:cytochrome P450
VRRLARDPALQSRLRGEPALMPAFIDELLRLDGSVQALLRVATRDLEVDGMLIPKGANVVLSVTSANRDEQRWADPDALQPDRSGGRRHLSFGQGPHSCVGVHLARRILQSAFETLLKRLDPIELAIDDSEVEQLPLPFHRAMARLPIRFRLAPA